MINNDIFNIFNIADVPQQCVYLSGGTFGI